jgi:hypothetical protein
MPEDEAAPSSIALQNVDKYLTGTLKRSRSYSTEYGSLTIPDLQRLAKTGDRKASKMLKLVKQAARLREKMGGKS